MGRAGRAALLLLLLLPPLLLLPQARAAAGPAEDWDARLAQLAPCFLPLQACVAASGWAQAASRAACEADGNSWHQPFADGAALQAAVAAEIAALEASGALGSALVQVPADMLLSEFEAVAPGAVSSSSTFSCGTNTFFALVEASAAQLSSYSTSFAMVLPPVLKVSPDLAMAEARAKRASVSRTLTLTPKAAEDPDAAIASWQAVHAERRRLAGAEPLELTFSYSKPKVDPSQPNRGERPKKTKRVLVSVNKPASAEVDDALSFLSSQPGVEYVLSTTKLKLHNIDAAYITQSGTVRPSNTPADEINEKLATIWEQGITGNGQVVGVADTGVDTMSCFFSDTNEAALVSQRRSAAQDTVFTYRNHRKLVMYHTFFDGTDAGRTGHGTHVAGSAVGSIPDVPQYRGMAFDAKLAFTDIGGTAVDSTTGETGVALNLPNNLDDILKPAYDNGARIHSNSWGAVDSNAYDTFSQNMDEFTFENQDLLILVAAGNEGERGGSFGKIGPPATAKNVLAVGASQNSPASFESIGVTCSLVPDSCGNNLAEFSSNGPTLDGRIKPEVVAPGELIQSASSNPNNEATCFVAPLQGTSMSTPITAGNAALVRQYFTDGFYPTGAANATNAFSPMGATLKAMLINGATVLNGLYGSTSLASEVAPSRHQGWGRIRLDKNLVFASSQPSARNLFVYDGVKEKDSFTRSGQTRIVPFVAEAGDVSLRFTLVWSDKEAAVQSTSQLINDLDLVVKSPSGRTFFPNGRTSKDSTNVVEHIEINADVVESGTYTATISSARIINAQPFAFVISGSVDDVAVVREDESLQIGEIAAIAVGALVFIVAAVILAQRWMSGDGEDPVGQFFSGSSQQDSSLPVAYVLDTKA